VESCAVDDDLGFFAPDDVRNLFHALKIKDIAAGSNNIVPRIIPDEITAQLPGGADQYDLHAVHAFNKG
jgi:hypothetical protein